MPRGKKRPNIRSAGNSDLAIGGRLRAMRLDRGLSQEALGLQLGVSFQQVQKYEKGVNRLSVGRMMQIARLFKCSPDELTGGVGAQDEGFLLDAQSYKLARTFARLPPDLKLKLRSLIDSIIENAD
jgi:transcriptional regulator with XRE-family HTH domain